jgi:hypothetical protein
LETHEASWELTMQKPPRRTSTAASTATSNWGLRDRSVLDGSGEGSGQQASPAADDTQALINDFDASLQADADLDQEGREFLSQQFRTAVREAASSGATSRPLERSDWLETLEALRDMGVVDEDESNTLVRQLDQALQPLQSRNVQVALEFSRRCSEQDEQGALEWLRAQTAEAPKAQQPSSPPSPQLKHAASGDTVTQSRSRRLRGPPVR